jgi:hypothetical protein
MIEKAFAATEEGVGLLSNPEETDFHRAADWLLVREFNGC